MMNLAFKSKKLYFINKFCPNCNKDDGLRKHFSNFLGGNNLKINKYFIAVI